jgi:hypothetical protein
LYSLPELSRISSFSRSNVLKTNENVSLRWIAFSLIDENDAEIFTDVAKTGKFYDVRLASAYKLNDPALIHEISVGYVETEDFDGYLYENALKNLTEEDCSLLGFIALNGNCDVMAMTALKQFLKIVKLTPHNYSHRFTFNGICALANYDSVKKLAAESREEYEAAYKEATKEMEKVTMWDYYAKHYPPIPAEVRAGMSDEEYHDALEIPGAFWKQT